MVTRITPRFAYAAPSNSCSLPYPLINQMMAEAFTSGKGLFFVPNIDGHVLKQGYNATIEEKKLKQPFFIKLVQ